jgi:hypothetical protein
LIKTPQATNFNDLHALAFAFCLKHSIRPDCIKLDTATFSRDLEKILNGSQINDYYFNDLITRTEQLAPNFETILIQLYESRPVNYSGTFQILS